MDSDLWYHLKHIEEALSDVKWQLKDLDRKFDQCADGSKDLVKISEQLESVRAFVRQEKLRQECEREEKERKFFMRNYAGLGFLWGIALTMLVMYLIGINLRIF